MLLCARKERERMQTEQNALHLLACFETRERSLPARVFNHAISLPRAVQKRGHIQQYCNNAEAENRLSTLSLSPLTPASRNSAFSPRVCFWRRRPDTLQLTIDHAVCVCVECGERRASDRKVVPPVEQEEGEGALCFPRLYYTGAHAWWGGVLHIEGNADGGLLHVGSE